MKANSSTTKKPPVVRIKGATPKFFEENEFNTMQIVSYLLPSWIFIFLSRDPLAGFESLAGNQNFP